MFYNVDANCCCSPLRVVITQTITHTYGFAELSPDSLELSKPTHQANAGGLVAPPPTPVEGNKNEFILG